MSLTFTPEGFPWPQDFVLYHATIAYDAILDEGFKTREALGGIQATGGGTSRAISLAADPRVCRAICVGLFTLAMGARGRTSLRSLWNHARRDCPLGAAAAWKSKQSEGWTEAAIDRASDGFRFRKAGMVTLPLVDDLPPGSVPIETWLERSGPALNPDWSNAKRNAWNDNASRMIYSWWEPATQEWLRQAFLDHYQAILTHGASHRECYDPFFMGTSMTHLAEIDPEQIGVIALRAKVPRILPTTESARDLGYLTNQEAVQADSVLRPMQYAAARALDSAEGSQEPAHIGGFYKPTRLGEFAVEIPKEPKPWRSARTLIGLSSMSEIRAYDPTKLIVDRREGIPLEWVFDDIGGIRMFYPYFQELVGRPLPGEDVRHNPGSVSENLSLIGMAIIAADFLMPDPIPFTPSPITAAVLAGEMLPTTETLPARVTPKPVKGKTPPPPFPEPVLAQLQAIALSGLGLRDLGISNDGRTFYLLGPGKKLQALAERGDARRAAAIYGDKTLRDDLRYSFMPPLVWDDFEELMKRIMSARWPDDALWPDGAIFLPIPDPGGPQQRWFSVKARKWMEPVEVPLYSVCSDEDERAKTGYPTGPAILRSEKHPKLPPFFISHAVKLEHLPLIEKCSGFLWPSLAFTWKIPPGFGEIVFLFDVDLLARVLKPTGKPDKQFHFGPTDIWSPRAAEILQFEMGVNQELRGNLSWWNGEHSRAEGGWGNRGLQYDLLSNGYPADARVQTWGSADLAYDTIDTWKSLWQHAVNLVRENADRKGGLYAYQRPMEVDLRSGYSKYPYFEMKIFGIVSPSDCPAVIVPKVIAKNPGFRTFLRAMHFSGAVIEVATPVAEMSDDPGRAAWATDMTNAILRGAGLSSPAETEALFDRVMSVYLDARDMTRAEFDKMTGKKRDAFVSGALEWVENEMPEVYEPYALALAAPADPPLHVRSR